MTFSGWRHRSHVSFDFPTPLKELRHCSSLIHCVVKTTFWDRLSGERMTVRRSFSGWVEIWILISQILAQHSSHYITLAIYVMACILKIVLSKGAHLGSSEFILRRRHIKMPFQILKPPLLQRVQGGIYVLSSVLSSPQPNKWLAQGYALFALWWSQDLNQMSWRTAILANFNGLLL